MSTEATPYVGRTITRHDGVTGTVVRQEGLALYVQYANGDKSCIGIGVFEQEIARQAQRAKQASGQSVAKLGHDHFVGQNAGLDLRAKAREAVALMEHLRGGMNSSHLTPAEQARILESVRKGPPANLSPADAARIRNRLQGKPEAADFQAGVTRHLHAMIKSGRRAPVR